AETQKKVGRNIPSPRGSHGLELGAGDRDVEPRHAHVAKPGRGAVPDTGRPFARYAVLIGAREAGCCRLEQRIAGIAPQGRRWLVQEIGDASDGTQAVILRSVAP